MSHPPVAESPRPSSVGSVQSSHSSSRGGRKHQFDICVGEEVKIAVDIAIERFRLSEEQKGLYCKLNLLPVNLKCLNILFQFFLVKFNKMSLFFKTVDSLVTLMRLVKHSIILD